MVKLTIDIEKLKKKFNSQEDFRIVENKIYYKEKIIGEYNGNSLNVKDTNFIVLMMSYYVNPF